MNGEEIIELLKSFMKENNVSISQLENGDNIEPDVWEALQNLAGGMEFWDEVISRAGGEQQQHEVVLKFKKHKVYIAFVYYYNSWSGSNFDDCEPELVVPAKRTETYWKRL